jgi:prevent-host-death family protein
MSLLSKTKPISYLKANAAQVAKDLKENGGPYMITQNGEPAMIVQSVHEYQQTQETMALLKMLAQSERDISEGNTVNADEAIGLLRRRRGL